MNHWPVSIDLWHRPSWEPGDSRCSNEVSRVMYDPTPWA